MDRPEAIKILKATGCIGNDVSLAIEQGIKSMKQLEEIEHIINQRPHIDFRNHELLIINNNSEKVLKIREILNEIHDPRSTM